MSFHYPKAGNFSLFSDAFSMCQGHETGACAVPKGPLVFWGTLLSFGTFCKHFRPPHIVQAEKNKLSMILLEAEGVCCVFFFAFLQSRDNCPALASKPRAASNGFALCSQEGR